MTSAHGYSNSGHCDTLTGLLELTWYNQNVLTGGLRGHQSIITYITPPRVIGSCFPLIWYWFKSIRPNHVALMDPSKSYLIGTRDPNSNYRHHNWSIIALTHFFLIILWNKLTITSLLLILVLWWQVIFESKGGKLSSSAECRIQRWEIWDTSIFHRIYKNVATISKDWVKISPITRISPSETLFTINNWCC